MRLTVVRTASVITDREPTYVDYLNGMITRKVALRCGLRSRIGDFSETD